VTNDEQIDRIMDMADEEEIKQIGLDDDDHDADEADDTDDTDDMPEMPAEFFRTQDDHSKAFVAIVDHLLKRYDMGDPETLDDADLRPIVHAAVMYTLEWEGAAIDGYIDFADEETAFRELLSNYSELGEQLLDIRDEALGLDGDGPE